jgi:hypothetical protein
MQKVLFLFVLGLLFMSGNAQDRKNSVKFLPVNLPLNSLSFEYERMINPKNSFEMGLGIPMNQTFVNKFSMDWSEEEKISNDELGVFSLRAAFKHYTGNSVGPVGFYYSPYLKYQNVSASARIVRTVDDDEGSSSYNEDYNAKINTFGIGIQFGYQFLIAKRVTLDLYFLGLEAGFAGVNGTIESSDITQVDDIESDIQDTVDDFPDFLSKKIDVSSNGNTVKVKAHSIFYPWVRGGLSIGFVF